jgi:hypothetical protein
MRAAQRQTGTQLNCTYFIMNEASGVTFFIVPVSYSYLNITETTLMYRYPYHMSRGTVEGGRERKQVSGYHTGAVDLKLYSTTR